MSQNIETQDYFLWDITYSDEDEKLGMLCTCAGSTTTPPGTDYPPHKEYYSAMGRMVATGRILPDFQVVYITRGEGVFSSGGVTYKINPGSLMLLIPGIKHAYKPTPEIGWHEYWVGFRGAHFERLLEEGFFSPEKCFFETGLYDPILSLFSQIIEEVKIQRPLYQMKACAAILGLIAEVLTRDRRKDQPNYYQQIVEKAKYLMESNIFSLINLSDISDQLGISTSRFNEIFKTYTSMTPYQYYIHIKIHKSKRLLEQKELSVKEVAYKMGFDDQNHFSRLFKNKTGVSPSNWKDFIS